MLAVVFHIHASICKSKTLGQNDHLQNIKYVLGVFGHGHMRVSDFRNHFCQQYHKKNSEYLKVFTTSKHYIYLIKNENVWVNADENRHL